MKVLVGVKRVLDHEAKIDVMADGSGIERYDIKSVINPFDEIAVEEAVRLKEKGRISEIVVASIGSQEAVQQLRYAMAMGADRAILVETDEYVDSDLASSVFKELFKKDDYGLVLMGKQAIDSDAGQCPQLLAAKLNIAQASFASKIMLEQDFVSVTCEVDGGLETIRVKLPAVISTDLRLNEPRYASLPNIMKAKKKEIESIALNELKIDAAPKLKILKLSQAPQRARGRIVKDVPELIKALKEEAGLF